MMYSVFESRRGASSSWWFKEHVPKELFGICEILKVITHKVMVQGH